MASKRKAFWIFLDSHLIESKIRGCHVALFSLSLWERATCAVSPQPGAAAQAPLLSLRRTHAHTTQWQRGWGMSCVQTCIGIAGHLHRPAALQRLRVSG